MPPHLIIKRNPPGLQSFFGKISHVAHGSSKSTLPHHAAKTPLHVADSGAARLLISLGADTSVKGSTGAIPLHYMAAKGQVKAVEMLAQQQSSAPNMINKHQQTPRQFPCQNGHMEIVAALLRIGAFAHAVDADGGRQLPIRETLAAHSSRHDAKHTISGIHVGFSRRRTATS